MYSKKMKKLIEIPLLFFLTVSLCSCPYSSPYNLDETPYMPVQDNLLGNWSAFVTRPNSTRSEPLTVSLRKKTETEYDIVFSGYLEDMRPFVIITADSIKGTGFVSEIGDKQFLNIKVGPRIYLAEMRLKEGRLSLLPLAENFTSKMIFNSNALRGCVEFHYKNRVHPMLDPDFSLKDMTKFN
jgi:hypothetical protein